MATNYNAPLTYDYQINYNGEVVPPPPFPVGPGGSVPYYTRYPTVPKRDRHYERLLREDEELLIILEEA